MSLLMAGGLEIDDLQARFQPLPFYDSMILYSPGAKKDTEELVDIQVFTPS